MRAVRCDSRRSRSTASRQPCEVQVSRSEYALAARSAAPPPAATRSAGPPWRTLSASPRQRSERLAGEREAKRVADRSPHVVERLARRRRPEHDRVVGRIDDDHTAAGQEGQFQGMERYSRSTEGRKPRLGQKRDASRGGPRPAGTTAPRPPRPPPPQP